MKMLPMGCGLRWVVTLLALGAGCPFTPSPELCDTTAVPGLRITVRNVDDNQPICDATVTATAPNRLEPLEAQPGDPCVYVGAYERPGTYQLDATRTGFRPTQVGNVVVEQDDCHVIPQERTLLLVPN